MGAPACTLKQENKEVWGLSPFLLLSLVRNKKNRNIDRRMLGQ